MAILDKITEVKRSEVEQAKSSVSINELKNSAFFNRRCNSLVASLNKTPFAIIAEFKQKSPSKGIINATTGVQEVTRGYTKAGAAGISVLTDTEFFGGKLQNLVQAREANPETPILRKDFIIDTYQVYEAKANGADVILLIAACLEKEELNVLAATAKSLGLEVLVEVHNKEELEKISPLADIVGVNNRNLKTFRVDIQTSINLAKQIPCNYMKISESGISDVNTIKQLAAYGFRGFLIGETFMKTESPHSSCMEFISELNK